MAWIRDTVTDELKISFQVTADGDPELLLWLHSLPYRQYSKFIRDALMSMLKSGQLPVFEHVGEMGMSESLRAVFDRLTQDGIVVPQEAHTAVKQRQARPVATSRPPARVSAPAHRNAAPAVRPPASTEPTPVTASEPVAATPAPAPAPVIELPREEELPEAGAPEGLSGSGGGEEGDNNALPRDVMATYKSMADRF